VPDATVKGTFFIGRPNLIHHKAGDELGEQLESYVNILLF